MDIPTSSRSTDLHVTGYPPTTEYSDCREEEKSYVLYHNPRPISLANVKESLNVDEISLKKF